MSRVVVSIQASTDDEAAVADTVRRCMRDALGQDAPLDSGGCVRRVFPEGTPGRRGKLFTMTVPDGLPRGKIEEFIGKLKGSDSIADAGIPESKWPMTP